MRALTIAILLASTLLIAQPQKKNSCAECHSAMDGALQKPAILIQDDIHTANGLSCTDCHGGDHTSDDMTVAMGKAAGFIGKPKRAVIPQLCANCHSKPDFMRRYKPQQRVDQFELYKTSVHGKKLAGGDDNVATCIDCHSVHDIRAVKDPQSPVYPLHIPDTCGRCHADAQRMAKYGIPTNQLEQYRTSVHYADLKNGDLAAPTCASCHGNHGAKPPDVESVAAVCGNCHALFAQNYDKSVHAPIFSGASGGGGCIVCHSNHGIKQPSTAMLIGPKSVCASCHDPGTQGARTAAQMADWINSLDAALKHSETVVTQADKVGMEVSEAEVRLGDGRENLVKARLAMHTFQPDEMHKPIEAGIAIANETLHDGQAALHEKDIRRRGLVISAFFIALTVFGIWLLIKRLESNGSGYLEPTQ
jgi:nitrate/TMAO reductase-like tetraheme cytochrome c subunit